MALSLPGSGPLSLPDLTTGYPMLGGMFRNLKLNANGTTAVVNVTADALVLESVSAPYTYLTVRSIVLTASIAVSLVGGMDVGTSAASTWYSVWVISNGTATNTLLSLSATAPTMPTGYTHRARVGWIRTDATANKFPFKFVQYGNAAQYAPATGTNITGYPQVSSGVVGNTSLAGPGQYVAKDISTTVPSTALKIQLLGSQTAANTMYAAPSNMFSGINGTIPPPYAFRAFSNTGLHVQPGIMVLETVNQIFVAADGASCGLSIVGWEDNL